METRFVNYELVELDMSEFTLDDIGGIDKLEIVYLDSYEAVHNGVSYDVKHYPIDDLVKSYEDDSILESKLERLVRAYKFTIAHKIKEANGLATKIYFSPANRFGYSATIAEPFYCFSYEDENGDVTLMFEGNFLVL